MNYETQQFVPCDACGEEFPQHMVSNRYGNDLTCDCCTEQIARDFEQSYDDNHRGLTAAELEDWGSQYDNNPNPYSEGYGHGSVLNPRRTYPNQKL